MFLAADSLVLALRALSLVALFQAAGHAIFIDKLGAGVSRSVGDRIRTHARIWAVTALCVGVVHYVLTPARMAGSLDSTFDPSLGALLLESNAGVANIARIVGLAVLFLSLDRASKLNTIAGRVGIALTIASFALMGHTAIHPLRWLLAPLLVVHVAVVAFWFGALGPLFVVASREPPAHSALTIARFSALATRLVPLILVSGALIALVFIRSFAELRTGYGAIVVGKVLAFGGLMWLAALNKWRYGPAIGSGDRAALDGFKRTVAIEWVVLSAVLVATALLTALFAPEHLEGTFDHAAEPEHDPEAPIVAPAR